MNAAALDSMRGHSLSGQVVVLLDAHPARLFANTSARAAHLAHLGIDALAVTPDPVQVATEGALWGAVCHHGLLAEAVIVSDGAGQFRAAPTRCAGCTPSGWVHKLVPATPEQRRAVEVIPIGLSADLIDGLGDPGIAGQGSKPPSLVT